MAIVTIPTVCASGAVLSLIRGDATQEYMDGSSGTIASTKAVWSLTFPMAPQRAADAKAWQAALMRLSTPVNQFKITPPGWQNGVNYTGVDGSVVGVGQYGLTLSIDGLPTSTAIAKAGDFIEIADTGEVKMLTQDATTDGAGAITLAFEPFIRVAPGDNTAVIFDTPQITMRLLTPQASWSMMLPNFVNMNINAIEHY